MVSQAKKALIRQTINAVEQGRVTTKYDVLYIYNDGPSDKKQLTLSFGITEYGNLKKLVKKYIDSNGQYSTNFKKHIDKIGSIPLVDNKEFKVLLIEAARNDEVFRNCMEEIYDEMYWNPAVEWFVNGGFTTCLSMMVITDSFIHSGSILGFLRNRFSEYLPSMGGDEKKWIKQYIETRHMWLAGHSRKILRNTVYRTEFLKREMDKGNWSFDCPFVVNGVKVC